MAGTTGTTLLAAGFVDDVGDRARHDRGGGERERGGGLFGDAGAAGGRGSRDAGVLGAPGAPLGAKSGRERVNPLAYQDLGGGRVAVFGSKAGGPTNPDWFHNVKANPGVTMEVGSATVGATARVADGEERDRIWEQQKKDAPGFAEYETKTTRQIPVIVLTPTP